MGLLKSAPRGPGILGKGDVLRGNEATGTLWSGIGGV